MFPGRIRPGTDGGTNVENGKRNEMRKVNMTR